MTLQSLIKGWFGEVQGTLAKKIFLDGEIYKDVNNVTIQTKHGTTQVDHVIVSKFGIFVVETKNMDGWIFGDEQSHQWTQSMVGKKYRFQNPLHQNYRHTKALAEFLEIDHEKLFSMVMFWGDAEFKTPMPENVMNRGYTSYIKRHQDVLFTDDEVEQIVTAIKTGMLPKSWATRRKHVGSLKERFSSTQICPRCGSSLVLRTAKSGQNAGSQFHGCSKFPSCRYVAKIEPVS